MVHATLSKNDLSAKNFDEDSDEHLKIKTLNDILDNDYFSNEIESWVKEFTSLLKHYFKEKYVDYTDENNKEKRCRDFIYLVYYVIQKIHKIVKNTEISIKVIQEIKECAGSAFNQETTKKCNLDLEGQEIQRIISGGGLNNTNYLRINDTFVLTKKCEIIPTIACWDNGMYVKNTITYNPGNMQQAEGTLQDHDGKAAGVLGLDKILNFRTVISFNPIRSYLSIFGRKRKVLEEIRDEEETDKFFEYTGNRSYHLLYHTVSQ
ncbi:PIR Superfamily Protein [Plasmodium ovale curtisi]|uniref:PIR Superfamily Protein n=1 Tax=Plasmodium ovale curtisi TaxID=864141 RepID=A0A1A8X5P2_PLAOA|nr:PIR Superfamily Protein [Plasmodium ovale curtisi]